MFRPFVIASFFGVLILHASLPILGQEPVKADSDEEASFRELTIYVPCDKLRETFEVEGRGVFLPYEKFQSLWKAAREKLPTPQEVNPPVKAVITEIENEAHVKNDVIHVSAKLTIELLDSGWVEVPLRLRDVAVLSATINGKPALLVPGKTDGQTLLVKHDATDSKNIVLNLEYAKSISKSPGQNSVAFEAPLAPVNQWRIRIPESGVKVNVSPMLAATEEHPKFRTKNVAAQSDANDESINEASLPPIDETVILAFVGAARSLNINWTPKAEGASGLDALVSVQTITKVSIEEGVTVTQAVLNYDVSRSELPELKIEVPNDQKITNVMDTNVKNWNVATSGNKQFVTIGLFQPVRKEQTILLELEKLRNENDKQVVVPTIESQGVDRQRGLVLIRVTDGIRIEPNQRSGFVQVDQADIPADIKTQNWVYAYRYSSLPHELIFDVQRVQSKIYVDQLVEVYLQPQALTIDLFAKLHIERAPVFELEFDLPQEFEILEVQGKACNDSVAANVESHFVEEGADGSKRLKVNLATKAIGNVGLLIELEKPLTDANLMSATGEASKLRISPPRVSAVFAQSAKGSLVLFAPEGLRTIVDQLTGLRNTTFDEAYKSIPSNRNGRFFDARQVQAFSFSLAEAMADLSVERRQPQISMSQMLVTRIEPGSVKYESTLFYDIRYSSIKSLRLDVPTEIANLIHNESKSLRDSVISPSPDNLADGYVAWKLTGETDLLGQIECRLRWESPIDELAIGKSTTIKVPRLVPQDIDRSDGQIVLVKSETIDVMPTSETNGIDPIDPQHDLMRNQQIAEAAAALEYHDDDWELTIKATRYQLEVLKQTSIEQALLRNVVTRSDRISVQALYRMRSNKQRLKVELPDDVSSGSIEFDTDPLRINGNRTNIERGDDNRTFYIPLVGIDASQPFVLELRYTTSGGASRITYPDFPDEPAVQKVNLVAYLPVEQKYLGRTGPWTDEFHWSVQNGTQWVPRPKTKISRLIEQVIDGISIAGNPASDFPTDGQPLLFSTLRPEGPEQGALRLTTINGQLLHGIMFGVVGLAGVLLVRRSVWDKIAVVCGLVAIIVLIGVFLPAFVNALAGQVIWLALGAVALFWAVAFFLGASAQLKDIHFHWPFSNRQTPTSSETLATVPPILDESQNENSNTGGGDNV